MEVGRKGRPSQSCCKQCGYDGAANWKRNHPEVALVDYARNRAKQSGLPFNITSKDISIPDFCPVLGIPLVKGDGVLHDSSPTLDRLNPELGYVKGNVVVISYKANRIKNNGDLKDLKAVAEWMESVQKEGCLTEPPQMPEPIWRVEGDLGYQLSMRIAELSEEFCNNNLSWGSLPIRVVIDILRNKPKYKWNSSVVTLCEKQEATQKDPTNAHRS